MRHPLGLPWSLLTCHNLMFLAVGVGEECQRLSVWGLSKGLSTTDKRPACTTCTPCATVGAPSRLCLEGVKKARKGGYSRTYFMTMMALMTAMESHLKFLLVSIRTGVADECPYLVKNDEGIK